MVKNLPAMRDPGLIPGWRRSPGGGHGNPLQFFPRISHGQRSLVGYSPWSLKELEKTEQLTFSFIQVWSYTYKHSI